MQSFMSPNAIFLLIIVAPMLFIWSMAGSKSRAPMMIMALCLLVAGYGLISLRANPWALVVVGMSLLPFLIALRRPRPSLLLLLATVPMLHAGALFLFTNPDGRPPVSYGLAGLTAAVCGEIMWIGSGRRQNADGRTADDESIVGMIGTACADIEDHVAGFVEVDGDRCMARSKIPIPAGKKVRFMRRDGFVLTVREERESPKE